MSDTRPGAGQGPGGPWPPPPGPGRPPAPTPPTSSGNPMTVLLVLAGAALFVSFVCAVVLGLDDDFFTSVKIELASWLRDLGLLAAAVLVLTALLPKVLEASRRDSDQR